jgi:hypothetical protein
MVCLLGFATLALIVSVVAIYIKGHVAADIKLPWIEFHIVADPPPEKPSTLNHGPP